MRVIQESQLRDWLDSPVAEVFKYILEKEINDTYSRRAEVFYPGEPHRTQDTKAQIIGEELVLQDFLDMFKYDNSSGVFDRYFEENRVQIIAEEGEE